MCDDKRMSYEETLDATKEELFDENDGFAKAEPLTLGNFDELPEDDSELDKIDFDELLDTEE